MYLDFFFSTCFYRLLIASCFNWFRPQLVTRGCEAFEVTPLRDGVGQPGFLMNEEGFVTELQRFCYAESGGLQLWARVVRLCGHSLVHLSTEERTRLLRTAHKIHITVIPPDENGKPRRWVASAKGRQETTKQQTVDVSGKEERFFSGGVTVDDSLQSLSHQLASDQSMPLMISNHSGTGCPTVPSTASFQLKSQTAVDRIAGINKIKLDTSAALNFRAAFVSWQQERPQREGENAFPSLIYLYFTSAWCMCRYNKAQIATKMSYLLTGGGSRLILKTYNRDLNK